MKMVTPEAAKNQVVRKAWQDFKKDYPSFPAVRLAKLDFGPELDTYAKQANIVEVLVSKAEGLKSELTKSYLKFMACARTYEGIIEKEDIDPRLPAAFRTIIGKVTGEQKGTLDQVRAAA